MRMRMQFRFRGSAFARELVAAGGLEPPTYGL
jgi:hypothetical protein